MRRLGLLIAVIPALVAQAATSPCDLNSDGVVNVGDVQIAVNQALGLAACTMNLDGTGVCDITDVQRIIAAALGGACIVTSPASSNITLPIEVMGAAGSTNSASFSIPNSSASVLSGAQTMSLQIHGLKYETEASVQVNNSSWIPINSSNSTLQGLARAYGGIGGGFHTISLTMSLPAGTVVTGNNTITFKFNGTDGVTSGYRVLALNVIGSDGSSLIPPSSFVWDNPSSWQPPSTAASDIAAGQALYTSGPLTVPLLSGGTASIHAHCSDCHAHDGRDLKYFNYSNNSIVVRSQFHGLTAQQGNQIASYIRSLNTPSPGRPWNPPYQPGPALDSLPVANWAAGAGIGAVLGSDADMQGSLMPGGSMAGWAANRYLNARELPTALQFPDWNHWLPAVHPMDAFGSSFTNSTANYWYSSIRNILVANNATVYKNNKAQFDAWTTATFGDFLAPIDQAPNVNWDANNGLLRVQVYSMARWNMVKLWEINQEFGLEGMPQAVFGANAESRAWYSEMPFLTSPNMLHMPAGVGLGNGSQIMQTYLSYIWYHVQLVLNDSSGTQQNNSPIDYPYVYGFVKDLSNNSGGTPNSNLLLTWFIKALQEETQRYASPALGDQGWSPTYTTPEAFVDPGWTASWSATPAASRTAMMTVYVQSWFPILSSFTPQQYYQGGWANAADDPATLAINKWGGELWFLLPRLRYFGVSPSITQPIASWAATVWPKGNWSLNQTATCNAALQCTSD